MFLKVGNGRNEWALFGNVERIDFGVVHRSVLKREELESYQREGLINLISKDCFPRDKPLDVGVIEFYRNEVRYAALFTGTAYVLNESGDTIEKISAQQRSK